MDNDNEQKKQNVNTDDSQNKPQAVVGHFDYTQSSEVSGSPQPLRAAEPPATDLPAPQPQGTDPYIGLTGSSLQEKKQPLPKGVYVIIGLIGISIIGSFFDSSQLSIVFTIGLVVSLLLAFGLLFRREGARKWMVILAALSVVLYSVALLLLVGFQQRVNSSKARYKEVISRVDERRLTYNQKSQLKALKAQIAEAEERAGNAIAFSITTNTIYMALNAAVFVYLTRPKVKEVFSPSEG